MKEKMNVGNVLHLKQQNLQYNHSPMRLAIVLVHVEVLVVFTMF